MLQDGVEYVDGTATIPDSDQCSIPSASLKEARFNENRTAGKAAVWSVLEFYRRMWLVIGVIVPMCFAIYAAWSYLIPNYLCIDPIKLAKVSCWLPDGPPSHLT